MAQKQAIWRTSCCNPFDKAHKNVRKMKLRPVTKKMSSDFPSILPGEMICDMCRKQVAREIEKLDSIQAESIAEEALEKFDDEQFFELEGTNDILSLIGETPLTKRKMQSKSYKEQKYKQVSTKIHDIFVGDIKPSDESEIISQLKEKFSIADKSEKVQILTIMPKSWSIRKLQAEFGVTNHMARKAKQLVREKGVMTTPNPKPGHSLSELTVKLVTSFYENDENSRIMPGKKDCISVRIAGQRVNMQKRLVLCNLKELHCAFKDKFPDQKIGFSKFADLRPRHCVLAGASGTHCVCVCTIHQNVKLMFHGAKLNQLTTSDGTTYPSYKDCITSALCDLPQSKCHLRTCKDCPGFDSLKEFILTALDEQMIEMITYKQWVSTDRCTLDTICSTPEEFTELFVEKLETLTPHSFIAKQQAAFFSHCKESLKPGELLIQADFSENYSFILQDAAQSYHWNNSQATIHPFVVYYRHSGEKCHLSIVIISDCLHHDTIAVYLFQKIVLSFLKEVLPCKLKKAIYFSDGAAAQYKNRKNFLNICLHENDFGIKAEWHFSATSHGKGACDGVGGTVKRLAARASLQKPIEDQITTPLQLFEWAKANIPGTIFKYCSCTEYQQTKDMLEKRFDTSRTIPGTRKLHSFTPVSIDTIRVKSYSLSDCSKDEKVTTQEAELEIGDICQ